MKLILLRHEKRNLLQQSFFTPLTEDGMRDRFNLVNPLSNENIDFIYSSPYLRTLETVLPTADYLEKPIQIEYGLYEYLHNPFYTSLNWYHTVDELFGEYPYIQRYINDDYKSVVSIKDFYVLEDERNLENRIIKMMNEIIPRHRNDTVLLVSHQAVINKIKDLYVKPTKTNTEFPMGHYEVYYI